MGSKKNVVPLVYLKARKRKNFCWIFSNFNLKPIWNGNHIIEPYSHRERTKEQNNDFRACLSVKFE